jgi:hypothetical protein
MTRRTFADAEVNAVLHDDRIRAYQYTAAFLRWHRTGQDYDRLILPRVTGVDAQHAEELLSGLNGYFDLGLSWSGEFGDLLGSLWELQHPPRPRHP